MSTCVSTILQSLIVLDVLNRLFCQHCDCETGRSHACTWACHKVPCSRSVIFGMVDLDGHIVWYLSFKSHMFC